MEVKDFYLYLPCVVGKGLEEGLSIHTCVGRVSVTGGGAGAGGRAVCGEELHEGVPGSGWEAG